MDTESDEVLSEAQKKDSLVYVCYERSLYHFFTRQIGMEHYPLFYVDRHAYLKFNEHGNEGILFEGDRLSWFIAQIERVESSSPELVISQLQKILSKNMVRIMLKTPKADGTFYNTSSLLEGYAGEGFLVTKTNETQNCIRVWHNPEELRQRMLISDDNQIEYGVLTPPEVTSVLPDLHGIAYLNHLLFNIFKCASTSDFVNSLYQTQNASIGEFRKLFESLEKEDIDFSSYGMQLKMNKHIKNKILPLTLCWNKIIHNGFNGSAGICFDTEYLYSQTQALETALTQLEKRFILLFGKPSKSAKDKYLSAGFNLVDIFDHWTAAVNQSLAAIVKVN